jgi:cysteine desulfurase
MAIGQRTYLDHNATSPLRPEVAAAVAHALQLPGNASSVHAEGRAARAAIEIAREKVARLVGARAKNVVFTSGGTEASNLVLSPSFRRLRDPGGASRLLVGATEHPCGLHGHRFPPHAVETIPVDGNGVIDLAWLAARLERAGDERVLVSVQLANNETGVLQPVAEIARLAREHGGLVHTDAVQAAGKVPVDVAGLGVDVLTLSAHKFGGPKGIGAVVLASDGLEVGERLIRGGGQEKGFRAGTENVAGIAGFGVAAELAADFSAEAERLRVLRDEAEAHVRRIAPEAAVMALGAERLPNTLAFAIPGLRAETALIAFDLEGVALSSGSACSSGKVKRSHVLDAMGVEPVVAEGVLRVSLGWTTTKEDVIRFAEACERVVGTLYKRKASAA